MLSKNERDKIITTKPEHMMQRLKERSHLFPFNATCNEMWMEITKAIKDPNKSVIVDDERENTQSSHICIFISDSGKVIAIPILISNERILVFTIKDVYKEENNPNWYVRKYNDIAKIRNMPPIPFVVKNDTPRE